MSSEYDLKRLSRYLSRSRITPYLLSSSSPQNAQKQYEENIWQCLRFMLVMHFLEVALRNEMDNALCELHGRHWFERPDALLEKQTKQLAQARQQLRNQRKDPTHDNFIAELPLGFWVGLLTKKYEGRQQYWRRALHKCFPLRPKDIERRELHTILDRLRRFRNKVAHHERILHHKPHAHVQEALKVLGWINPELKNWASEMLEQMPP